MSILTEQLKFDNVKDMLEHSTFVVDSDGTWSRVTSYEVEEDFLYHYDEDSGDEFYTENASTVFTAAQIKVIVGVV